MRFLITLHQSLGKNAVIPINYQYPLSVAIYRLIQKGNAEYAQMLHEKGYGRGFKFFTFSQISCPFKIVGDRLCLLDAEVKFQVAFHLPLAMESFIKGLFQSEWIDIADKKSRARFTVKSVESLSNTLQRHKENELLNVMLHPISPVVAGIPNEKGNYEFLSPDDSRFIESLIYNWRSKIATCYDEATSSIALLMMEVVAMKRPFKSRLITIKVDTDAETKIRGWMNFELKVTGEKRFVELLMDGGVGVYNSMGCGMVEVKLKLRQPTNNEIL